MTDYNCQHFQWFSTLFPSLLTKSNPHPQGQILDPPLVVVTKPKQLTIVHTSFNVRNMKVIEVVNRTISHSMFTVRNMRVVVVLYKIFPYCLYCQRPNNVSYCLDCQNQKQVSILSLLSETKQCQWLNERINNQLFKNRIFDS